jgi:Flp pilus assembly pilin Flp
MELITRFRHDASANVLPDYGLLIGMIALAVVASLFVLGSDLTAAMHNIAAQLGTAS